MTKCIICFEEKKKNLKCNNCYKISCKKCLKSYKKLECCNCNNIFLESNIKNIFNDDDILIKYIPYYIYKNYFFNEKTNAIINNHLVKTENQKNLRFGYIKSKVVEKEIFKRCYNNNCKGVFYINTINCSLCDNKICLICEETNHDPKECDPKILENLKNIKIDCKKCPYCYVYINKTIGCNSMKCTNCGASFNWRNLEIDNKKFNNLHYNTILNKNLNDEFLSNFVNNKFQKDENYLKHEKYKNYTFIKHKKYIPEKYKNSFLNLYKNYKNIFKKIQNQKIDYFLQIKNLLENNVNLSLDDIFDEIDLKFYKKLYIDEKKYLFILTLFDEIEENFINKIPFDVDYIKDFINTFHENNILLEKSIYILKDNEIIIKENVKLLEKKFIKFNKINYENNGKINLLDNEQHIHAKNVFNILQNYNICLDSSYAGSGKTFTSLYVAHKLKIKNLIILSPKIMNKKWIDIINFYNYKNKFNYMCLTFSELYNKNFEKNNNLFKHIYVTQNKSEINFNDYLLNFIDENTMFIIDEIHNSKKNSSICTKFIKSLSSTIYINNGYILGLSATPLEKKEEINIILNKISAISNYKEISFNKDKLSIFYKKNITSVKTIKDNEKEINSDNEKEINSDSDEILTESEEDNEDEIEIENINFNKKIDTISKTLKCDYNLYFKNHFYLFNTISNRKYQTTIKKIINILKNLFKKYNLTCVDILNFFKENALKEKILETNNLNDFNEIIENHLLKNKDLNFLNLDISKFKYFEELEVHLFYILFPFKHNAIPYKIIEIVKIFTLFYQYKFSLYDSYYFSQYSLFYIYKTLLNILFQKINFTINVENENNSITHLKNLNYLDLNLSEEHKEILQYAFTSIDVNTKKNINFNSLFFISLILKGLEQTETVYINYIYDMVEKFYKTEKYKIVIGISFTSTLNDLVNLFKTNNYNFKYINGEIKNKEEVIDKFQNDPNENLLIVNLKSLNCGIDLDDKNGLRERLVIILPSFSFTNLIQFIFRFKRKDTLSEPNIYIINNHRKILKNLINKYQSISNFKFDIPSLDNLNIINEKDLLNIL